MTGSGLFLGAVVDAEADGQPNANATGDGADEDGVTFATLTAGTTPTITVTAVVPGTAVLNAWIDFNGDGDWGDAGEQIFADQALSNGTNSLTATIPAGAVAGQAFARFRATSVAGYSSAGLAKDGEVEDYQVTLVAAKSSASRASLAPTFELLAAAFVTPPSNAQAASADTDRQVGEPSGKVVQPVDLVLEETRTADPRPTRVRAGFDSLDEQLVDQVFEGEADLLLDNGSGGGI